MEGFQQLQTTLVASGRAILAISGTKQQIFCNVMERAARRRS